MIILTSAHNICRNILVSLYDIAKFCRKKPYTRYSFTFSKKEIIEIITITEAK